MQVKRSRGWSVDIVWNPEIAGYDKVPIGDWCELDGITCEVWPRMAQNKELILAKMETEPEFKASFMNHKIGVQATLAAIKKRKERVYRCDEAGYRVKRVVGFVHSASFNNKYKMMPGSEGCSAPLLCQCTWDFFGGCGMCQTRYPT